MFITEKEAQRRLNSSKNLVNTLSLPAAIPTHKLPIPKEDKAAPPEIKNIAASLVAQGVPVSQVCKEFGVDKKDLRSASEQVVSASIEKVRNLALDRMLIALGLMTPDKMESATIKELSNITGNLSRVIAGTTPKEIQDNRVQFVIVAPEKRAVSDYKVIDV